MRTDLPIVLALAAKANAFFRGSNVRLEVLAGHPAFARVHDLTFVRQTGLGGEMVADAGLPWFRRLKNEGVNRIRPTLAAMKMDRSADGPWGLLSEGDRGLELWTPGIGRRFEGHDDLQPLRLTLTSGRFDRWSMKPPLSVDEASSHLQVALKLAQEHLEREGQTIAGNAVGKYLSLHEAESPELSGDLECIVPDIAVCAVPLFASAARCLSLLEATGWLTSKEDSARVFAEPLWSATRVALETTV
jgi:hypothetical protein